MQEQKRKGRLKIFFGYCAGVGKTYAMLQEAHQKLAQGIDVVAGYIEPHKRSETSALLDGIEVLPTHSIAYKGRTFQEFDLDGALKRHPQLLLVDELAHTNIIGSRHKKRYQDVEELLQAGIDVYTTINVQHLESLHDIVESITKIKVHERIPDHIFDQADDVKVIDIEISELQTRLKEGKIYPKQHIQRALANFFEEDNLIALRSIALRRCAERVNLISSFETKNFTKEHILVCLSASLTNQKVIRTAARMALALHADFTALYVETSNACNEKERLQLQENIALAKHLKADIVSTYGNDIAYQISQYAKTSGVSKVVMGRSYQKPSLFRKMTYVDRLNQLATNLEVFIIPDLQTTMKKQSILTNKPFSLSKKDMAITLAFCISTTLLSYLLYLLQFDLTNIILVFVLSTSLIGTKTRHPIYSIISSIYSVLIINFLFLEPRYTFHMYAGQYPLIFITMIVISLIISSLTHRLKKESSLASLHAYSMDILLETSQKLQHCQKEEEILQIACQQLHRMLKRVIICYPLRMHTLQKPFLYSEDGIEEQDKIRYTSQNECAVARWVLENNHNAGVSTNTLPHAAAFYLSIRKQEEVFAVIGIGMQPHDELPAYEKGMLIAILNEIALTFDSIRQQKLASDTILKNEWMNAIDHDGM